MLELVRDVDRNITRIYLNPARARGTCNPTESLADLRVGLGLKQQIEKLRWSPVHENRDRYVSFGMFQFATSKYHGATSKG